MRPFERNATTDRVRYSPAGEKGMKSFPHCTGLVIFPDGGKSGKAALSSAPDSRKPAKPPLKNMLRTFTTTTHRESESGAGKLPVNRFHITAGLIRPPPLDIGKEAAKLRNAEETLARRADLADLLDEMLTISGPWRGRLVKVSEQKSTRGETPRPSLSRTSR